MNFSKPEELFVHKPAPVDLLQVIPLIIAAALLTVGLAMFLSGTENGSDLVQPVIVVFGGTIVALLATFPIGQIAVALQNAVVRGIRGGTAPEEMVRAMMKVCDISRRDGLLGVADVRTNFEPLADICHLISQAADEEHIQFQLDKQRTGESVSHRMTSDVFLFTGIYAVLIGALGCIIRVVNQYAVTATKIESVGVLVLPLICGVTLALLMTILLGRLRTAHLREMMVIDIAYQGAAIILEDNNVQRLRNRLSLLIPGGIK
ncbi:MAG: hypothetical protein KTR33_02900 [Gammaproteobacteria bacterium]|nr:hypothetical protein [Gammaproteobacteria bacterium]